MITFDCTLVRDAFKLDVAFTAGRGVTALFGPSGSGKTTVLRLIAGLDHPRRGRVEIDGAVLLDTERRVRLPRHRRRVGFVFQDALLFPHLDVRANLLYGRWFTPPQSRTIDFDAVVGVLGIGHLLERRPDTLSGGERQRVAIGRALLSSPRILLMDEPLASLDLPRKLEILPFIERLRDDFDLPIVYVSHSREEVVRLARHVVRLEKGCVIAAGSPHETLTIATGGGAALDRFEVISILSGRLLRYVPQYQISVLEHPAGDIVVPGQVEPRDGSVAVVVRATDVTLARGPVGQLSVRTVLRGVVHRLEADTGATVLATIELAGGSMLRASVTRMAIDELGLAPGVEVSALIKAVSIDERGLSHRQSSAP